MEKKIPLNRERIRKKNLIYLLTQRNHSGS